MAKFILGGSNKHMKHTFKQLNKFGSAFGTINLKRLVPIGFTKFRASIELR